MNQTLTKATSTHKKEREQLETVLFQNPTKLGQNTSQVERSENQGSDLFYDMLDV